MGTILSIEAIKATQGHLLLVSIRRSSRIVLRIRMCRRGSGSWRRNISERLSF